MGPFRRLCTEDNCANKKVGCVGFVNAPKAVRLKFRLSAKIPRISNVNLRLRDTPSGCLSMTKFVIFPQFTAELHFPPQSKNRKNFPAASENTGSRDFQYSPKPLGRDQAEGLQVLSAQCIRSGDLCFPALAFTARLA